MTILRTAPKVLTQAVTLALGTWALIPAPASAGLLFTTADVLFSNTASVTDTEGGAASTNNDANLGTNHLAQFDSTTGVLMGTTLNLTSSRTQTLTVSAAGSGSSSSTKTSTGEGSSNAQIVAPGVDHTFPIISTSGSCTGIKAAGCTNTTSAASTSTNLNAASTSLDSYVGGATVLVSRTAPTLTATQSSNALPGTETTKYSVQWAGTLNATYDYLLHAAPSFDGALLLTLDLDFGTVFLGDSSSLSFRIFNAMGDRVGLDLDTISGSGDISKLTTDLLTFSSLGPGLDRTFAASLDTTTVGDFAATYLLSFSDADVGAASSRFSYNNYLTLNLLGSVTARSLTTTSVPEPTILALLGLGFAGLGLTRRRRYT